MPESLSAPNIIVARVRKKPNVSGHVIAILRPDVDEVLSPGRVISGRFRLERLLGRGGMGTVWQAQHLSLETEIAIKFLNAELSQRRDIRSRFAREASSAARIRSPNVVTVLDSGFTEDGLAFIAMELLEGEDLGRRLTRVGRLGLGETCSLVTQVARGLSRAHAAGIVHRDLKPENLFVVPEDDGFSIKILDFGIAKALGPEDATHKTDTGQLLGTPTYMSPEQALGRALDRRSDLYSLAVVAYRCLAGRPPFAHAPPGELIVAVSTRPAPPPSVFNPQLPPEIDAWFEGALAKEPGARSCQTAAELADSFERACAAALAEHPEPSSRRRAANGTGASDRARQPETTTLVSADELATTQVAEPAHTELRVAPRLRRRRSTLVAVTLAASSLAIAGLAYRSLEVTPEPASRTAPSAPRANPPSAQHARALELARHELAVAVSSATPAPPSSSALDTAQATLGSSARGTPHTSRASRPAARTLRARPTRDGPFATVGTASVLHPATRLAKSALSGKAAAAPPSAAPSSSAASPAPSFDEPDTAVLELDREPLR